MLRSPAELGVPRVMAGEPGPIRGRDIRCSTGASTRAAHRNLGAGSRRSNIASRRSGARSSSISQSRRAARRRRTRCGSGFCCLCVIARRRAADDGRDSRTAKHSRRNRRPDASAALVCAGRLSGRIAGKPRSPAPRRRELFTSLHCVKRLHACARCTLDRPAHPPDRLHDHRWEHARARLSNLG